MIQIWLFVLSRLCCNSSHVAYYYRNLFVVSIRRDLRTLLRCNAQHCRNMMRSS